MRADVAANQPARERRHQRNRQAKGDQGAGSRAASLRGLHQRVGGPRRPAVRTLRRWLLG